MYVCVCVCMRVCTYVRIYVCMYVRVSVYIYVCLSVFLSFCLSILFMHLFLHVFHSSKRTKTEKRQNEQIDRCLPCECKQQGNLLSRIHPGKSTTDTVWVYTPHTQPPSYGITVSQAVCVFILVLNVWVSVGARNHPYVLNSHVHTYACKNFTRTHMSI